MDMDKQNVNDEFMDNFDFSDSDYDTGFDGTTNEVYSSEEPSDGAYYDINNPVESEGIVEYQSVVDGGFDSADSGSYDFSNYSFSGDNSEAEAENYDAERFNYGDNSKGSKYRSHRGLGNIGKGIATVIGLVALGLFIGAVALFAFNKFFSTDGGSEAVYDEAEYAYDYITNYDKVKEDDSNYTDREIKYPDKSTIKDNEKTHMVPERKVDRRPEYDKDNVK